MANTKCGRCGGTARRTRRASTSRVATRVALAQAKNVFSFGQKKRGKK